MFKFYDIFGQSFGFLSQSSAELESFFDHVFVKSLMSFVKTSGKKEKQEENVKNTSCKINQKWKTNKKQKTWMKSKW